MIDYPKEIHIYVYMYYSNLRVWFNGKIPPCQGEDAGSIPATRLNIEKNGIWRRQDSNL